MTTLRIICVYVLFWICVCGGCTIRIGPLENTGENAPILPDPSGGSSNQPALDAAKQARKEEVERYVLQVVYHGATVLHSVQLPSGDVIDFLDRNTLPALPYALPALPFAPEDLVLPPGVSFGQTELEQMPELLELAALATPFVRPMFWPYVLGEAPEATSIEDFLARFQVGGSPSGTHQLYAGLVSKKPNRGVSGYMNQFRPKVDSKSLSLLEMAVACPAEGPVEEMVGIAISVDRINGFGPNHELLPDVEPRMHIEYARAANGPHLYVWDGMDGTFVNNPLRVHQPGEIVPFSILDTTSIEHLTAIFQSPAGDWWIAYNGDLLGYYPGNLFKMLNMGACRAVWYAEVYNPNPGTANTSEMGSGLFAEAGLLNAAHFRNPIFYDPLWSSTKPEDLLFMTPVEPKCYNRSALTYIGAFWDSDFLFVGGSGSKNPGCIWP